MNTRIIKKMMPLILFVVAAVLWMKDGYYYTDEHGFNMPLLVFTVFTFICCILMSVRSKKIIVLEKHEKLFTQGAMVFITIMAMTATLVLTYNGDGGFQHFMLSMRGNHGIYFITTGGLFFVLVHFIFLLTNNLVLTSDIIMAIAVVFDAVNYYLILFRQIPFMPWDIYNIGTAQTVAGNYEINCFPEFVIAILILLISHYAVGLVDYNVKYLEKKRIITELLIVVIGITAYFGVIDPRVDVPEYASMFSYGTYGSWSSFIKYVEKMRLTEPEGYSVEEIEKVLNSQTKIEESSGVHPTNIIMIMDEAYSDLSFIGDGVIGEGYSPFIENLTENTVRGNVYVDTIGGGTANTEFMALTGCSMRYLSGYPYQNLIKRDINSIAREMSGLGYKTLAHHPHLKSNYNRIFVYPKFGFDIFTGIDEAGYDMDQDIYRVFVSDEADFRYIEGLIGNENGKTFMHNVTIQNHGGYTLGEGMDFDYQKDLSEYGDFPNTEVYLGCVGLTDDAVRNLINYYSNEKEPTMICFFGDHQPQLEDEFYELQYGKPLEDLTEQERQQMYVTPFFIWANYDIEEEYIDKMSANYLGMYLMKTAGLELSEYQTYLYNLYKKYPVISSMGVYDSAGNYYGSDSDIDQNKDLIIYRNMIYYVLKDQK